MIASGFSGPRVAHGDAGNGKGRPLPSASTAIRRDHGQRVWKRSQYAQRYRETRSRPRLTASATHSCRYATALSSAAGKLSYVVTLVAIA